MACLFYLFVIIAVAAPTIFMWSFWRDAKRRQWNYTTETSRGMYVDVAKTLITASGIGVALVASASAHTLDSIAKSSSRVGVVSLIICISASLVTMLALTRGHERARSRNVDAGKSGEEGQLLDSELLFILIPGAIRACFVSRGRPPPWENYVPHLNIRGEVCEFLCQFFFPCGA